MGVREQRERDFGSRWRVKSCVYCVVSLKDRGESSVIGSRQRIAIWMILCARATYELQTAVYAIGAQLKVSFLFVFVVRALEYGIGTCITVRSSQRRCSCALEFEWRRCHFARWRCETYHLDTVVGQYVRVVNSSHISFFFLLVVVGLLVHRFVLINLSCSCSGAREWLTLRAWRSADLRLEWRTSDGLVLERGDGGRCCCR